MTKRYEELRYFLREEKKLMHKKLYNEKRCVFWAMDIAFILMFAMNLACLGITNVLVVKETPGQELLEVNPSQSAINGFKAHPNAYAIIVSFLIQGFWWAIIGIFYSIGRQNVYTNRQLTILSCMTIIYATLISFNLANDLGYMIGKLIFG